MKATINNIQIDLSKPIDISIPLTNNDKNPIAWYQNVPEIEHRTKLKVILEQARVAMSRFSLSTILDNWV